MSYVDKYETPSFYIYKAYGITTSSMDPKIKKGDVIIIKRCNQDDLKVGDIITKIDDIDINKMSELRKYIYSKNAGDEVNLIVLRNKKTYSIKIKLGKK